MVIRRKKNIATEAEGVAVGISSLNYMKEIISVYDWQLLYPESLQNVWVKRVFYLFSSTFLYSLISSSQPPWEKGKASVLQYSLLHLGN